MSAAEDQKRAGIAPKCAVVLSHTKPDSTAGALRAAIAEAERVGCEIAMTAEEIEKHGSAAEGASRVEEMPGQPDLCLALGGDGTILRALRSYAGTDVPVFGINYGTVGFIAAAESSELDEGLRRAFSGEYEIVDLPGLAVQVDGRAAVAVNDISFTRRPHRRVAELSYRLGGREVGHVRCDGLVAATPVGSTGYNLANNGPILAWGVEGYVVSFIAPHTLTARALVVAPEDILHVENAGERDPVDVAGDGEPLGELGPGAAIDVRYTRRLASLAQLEGETFYHRIREKFGRLVG